LLSLLLSVFGIRVLGIVCVRMSSHVTTDKKNQHWLTSNFLQIWGAAAGVSPGPSDLVWKSQKSWGSGFNIGVTLITDEGEVSELQLLSFY